MARRRVRNPEEIRNRAIGLVLAGWSMRDAAHQLNCSPKLVWTAYQKFRHCNPMHDAHRTGRKPKLGPRQVRLLVRNLNKDRSQTGEQLKRNTFADTESVSGRTIRRAVVREGFHKCRARTAPMLTIVQQLRRKAWATRYQHYDFRKSHFQR